MILTEQQKRRVALALGATAVLFFMLSAGSRGCIRQAAVHLEHRRLQKEIHGLEKTKAGLKAEKKKAEDPAEVERIAREQYGMSKKGEKVYRVVPKDEK